MKKTNTENFTSIGFILSAIGSAVGLGNIWKFPYITGANGGAAFFLLFLVFLCLIGLPILLAELCLGREGKTDVISCLQQQGGKIWGAFGYLFMAGIIMILAFYAVVTGWTIFYAIESFSGQLYKASSYQTYFFSFVSGWSAVGYTVASILITALVIWKGVTKGIERLNKILLPGLLILLLILLVKSLGLEKAKEGLTFFLSPDFSLLNMKSALIALGQAFFSLSIGMGLMLTYGSYVRDEQSLVQATFSVGSGNVLYAFIAGCIIFPLTYTYGLTATQGPELAFVALPEAFKSMQITGGIFFSLLACAALTSLVSLLEAPVLFLIQRFSYSRTKSTVVLAVLLIILGVPAALSCAGDSSMFMLAGKSLFEWFDFLSSNFILPTGGLVFAICIGYLSPKAVKQAKLSKKMEMLWLFLLRFIVPIGMVLVFLSTLGWI